MAEDQHSEENSSEHEEVLVEKDLGLKSGNKEVLGGEMCPMCRNKTLTLMEEEADVPYFGRVFIFGMTCSSCKYHKADIECAETRSPVKESIEISSEEDMKIRLVKSSEATVKIPHVISITPGPASEGYVTNVEGLLNRVKAVIEQARDSEDDDAAKKKAKNLLKKLQKVIWGQEKLTIIVEDPTGNSAIISEKTVRK